MATLIVRKTREVPSQTVKFQIEADLNTVRVYANTRLCHITHYSRMDQYPWHRPEAACAYFNKYIKNDCTVVHGLALPNSYSAWRKEHSHVSRTLEHSWRHTRDACEAEMVPGRQRSQKRTAADTCTVVHLDAYLTTTLF